MKDYSFAPYLAAVDGNRFEDDPLLDRLLRRFAADAMAAPGAVEDLVDWGGTVAGPLQAWAEISALPENRPRLRHHDAYGRRIDQIVLPASTLDALDEVEGRARLGAPHGDQFIFYAKAYLCWQNGEAGIACSMGCTDGLVRVLEAVGDRPEHRDAVRRVRASSPERVWHGAQFVTEVQGGSDVAANAVRAARHGDAYRLHGQKWFCSNINADYFLVTARPDGAPAGAEGVALFLVPAYLEDGDWRRNGYTVDRLKDKLGTRELATAEVTFDGAVAYPVGPLDRGLATLIRHVLVPSRFACVISAAASLRHAERVVDAYTGFRSAFGCTIGRFELVRRARDDIARERARALAAVFGLLRAWQAGDDDADAALEFRVMLSMAKPVLTRRATEGLHEAMMLLGGNGIEERFSPLPRLYRDSVIMETWEGPHNVLLAQARRDLLRLGADPAGFVARVTGDADGRLARDLAGALAGTDDAEAGTAFARAATGLVTAYADRILHEMGEMPGNAA